MQRTHEIYKRVQDFVCFCITCNFAKGEFSEI